MTYNINELEEFALSLPITQTARRTAQQFASEQPTRQKAEQVRLNTLAVHVVNDYLQMMGISTEDPSASDSWNPVVRLCADVADLEVTGVGRLECRPLKVDQQTCHVPPEVWSDRIGYVVVRIDESSFEATVLGFAQTVTSEELAISQLQPIEDLIDRINLLLPPPMAVTATVRERTRVNLSQWLVNTFEAGWQTVESLLNPVEPDLAFGFRSGDTMTADFRGSDSTTADPQQPGSIKRAKLIDLGMQLAGHPVALAIEVLAESDQKSNILLQVHPIGNRPYLPSLLQLIVLDESGSVFLEAQARSADNYIQLLFSGRPGEQFSVKVALGDASIVEDFVI